MEKKINYNLELVKPSIELAEPTYKLANKDQDYLSEWLPWAEKNTLEDTISFFKISQKQEEDNNGFGRVIIYKGEVAGKIGLHGINWANKTTSIGYWLGKDFQGKGIITQCAETLTSYCLNKLNLNRVEIRCASNNIKSQAIPERLGFHFEGILRASEIVKGKVLDHKVYSKIKE